VAKQGRLFWGQKKDLKQRTTMTMPDTGE